MLYKAKVKELRDEIDELKEASVPKEILFAERRGLKEQISDLKEKYDELYELHYK